MNVRIGVLPFTADLSLLRGWARRARWVAVLAVCVATSPAAAEVYKCAGERGRPIYQEMPCPPGKELRNFQSDPPEITVLPGSPKANEATTPAANARTGKDANADKAAKGSNAEKTAKAHTDKPRGDPAERKHLRNGMTEGEVRARVGTPDATTGQRSGRQMRWSWFPADGDPETVTTVTFVAGVVTSVERTLVKK